MSSKRIHGILWFITGIFLLLAAYLGWLGQSSHLTTVGSSQGSRSVVVSTVRGTIYDRNHQPLVNTTQEYRAALLPDTAMLSAVRSKMSTQAYVALVEKLADGFPAVAQLSGPTVVVPGLRLFLIPVRYPQQPIAPHLIGYLNASGVGVSGLERAYNDRLENYSGEATVSFAVNGAGGYLTGEEAIVKNTLSNSAGGMITTLDITVQQTVQTTIQDGLDKGAVVVLDPYTGELLACASAPGFHPDSIADSLSADNGALLNRALAQYDCGSVFKIVTAAAALEKGISSNRTYFCAGSMTVGATRFHCHARQLGHQQVNMEQAFAASCNLYFIQLAEEVGAEALLETAKRLGLMDTIDLADSLLAPACVLPSETELTTPAALANFSFGQGKLLLSPLHVARMTAAVTGDGVIPTVSLVTGEVDINGHIQAFSGGEGERALTVKTAKTLQRMMQAVVTEGTGQKAALEGSSAAGKTGTAQTGQLNNGVPVVHSWFTGYYPAENPQYVITVLVEDAENAEKNAAEWFCEISNNLIKTEREQTD